MGCTASGCHVAEWETIEQGCLAHGITKQEIAKLVDELNKPEIIDEENAKRRSEHKAEEPDDSDVKEYHDAVNDTKSIFSRLKK